MYYILISTAFLAQRTGKKQYFKGGGLGLLHQLSEWIFSVLLST